MKTILIIDDDLDLRKSMEVGLRRAGFAVVAAESAEEGADLIRRLNFDAIVLDRMMTGMDGLSFLCKIRSDKNTTPVIMLTAMDGTNNAIDGLEGGANDYLAKPFSMRELILRINNISSVKIQATKKMPGGLTEQDGEFIVNGNILPLSELEKFALSEMINGKIAEVNPMTIKRLREKLRLANVTGVDIISVRGKGYKVVVRN